MFGYTIADAADEQAFREAMEFIEHTLHFRKDGPLLQDVDGSLIQRFCGDSGSLELRSDESVACVSIESSQDIPIACLHKW